MPHTSEAAPATDDTLVDPLTDNDDPIAFPGTHDRLLERLQGNIVKGHGRNYAVNIFIQFKTNDAARNREELKRLASQYVTSAARQLVEGEQYRMFRLPGSLFGNLFLSRWGYRKLGFEAELATWFPDPKEGQPGDLRRPTTTNFVTGMKGAAGDLDDFIDDPVEPLEIAYKEDRIDALLLLADDSEDYLLREAGGEVRRMREQGIAEAIAVERGEVIRNARGNGIEHFGYVDGRSQPLFLASDFSGLEGGAIVPGRTQERVPGSERGELRYWNPFAKLSLALLKDPGVGDPDAYGSYYVFRKLEQNVRGFVLAERDLAQALDLNDDDRARAGAMAVGRFRDGTPLVLSNVDGLHPRLANDFRYDGVDATGATTFGAPTDRFGLKCPFQAHIRKVSPRQDTAADLFRRRLVRRGMTYGPPTDVENTGINDLPTEGVGLLFACFQRSIMQQFAFVQERWASSPLFPITGTAEKQTGLDAVIGQSSARPGPQHWRPEYGGTIAEPASVGQLNVPQTHPTSFTFNGFVKFRGGEFFFAPSLPFLLGP